jgi:hypothetical protein
MTTRATETIVDYLSPVSVANRGLDLASALYAAEPDRAAEIVKSTIEWYADTTLHARGNPRAAIVKLAAEREDDLLLDGYEGATDLGAGWSTLWLPEDAEDSWYCHIHSARGLVKEIAAI